MSPSPVVVWFRNAYRLSDQPMLARAVAENRPVIPVVILSPEEEGDWPLGGASRWWLHHSLQAFQSGLNRLGSRLVLKTGNPAAVLLQLIQETGAGAVWFNHRYEPAARTLTDAVLQQLSPQSTDVRDFHSNLLVPPGTILKSDGTPYKVYTPFWKAVQQQLEVTPPLPAPAKLVAPPVWPVSQSLSDWQLLPVIDWAAGFRETWQPGEVAARDALQVFITQRVSQYPTHRDIPSRQGTSRLSPHLHFGEISPRQIWHQLMLAQTVSASHSTPVASVHKYLSEVVWREFAHQLLYFFPQTTQAPLRPEFNHFPWAPDATALKAWQTGHTGYPIVDAGMRELWQTGWMHNRVRMIVASFLVKHLRQPWQDGARWFWDTLVDADLANNSFGWQWAAGCGADAAPYFRIFNPILQGEKFDPHGHYVRRWVPELTNLPNRYLHKPWQAPPLTLAEAGVTLSQTYPAPMVDHAEARQAALSAFQSLKQHTPSSAAT